MEKDVLPVHKDIIHLLDQFTDIQTNMRIKYKEYIEKNATNKVFGLDSFHYQCRLFDLIFKQHSDQYSFINNRMYCDYYKLYNMVKNFVKDSFKMEPRKRNFPVYKDLEPYKHYDMSDVVMLHDDISDMIHKSRDSVLKKEKEITRDSYDRRLNIENYIYNHTCNNTILKTKIDLYEKYLNSYHIYHMSFLSNLRERLRLFFEQTGPAPSIESLQMDSKAYPLEPKTKYQDPVSELPEPEKKGPVITERVLSEPVIIERTERTLSGPDIVEPNDESKDESKEEPFEAMAGHVKEPVEKDTIEKDTTEKDTVVQTSEPLSEQTSECPSESKSQELILTNDEIEEAAIDISESTESKIEEPLGPPPDLPGAPESEEPLEKEDSLGATSPKETEESSTKESSTKDSLTKETDEVHEDEPISIVLSPLKVYEDTPAEVANLMTATSVFQTEPKLKKTKGKKPKK